MSKCYLQGLGILAAAIAAPAFGASIIIPPASIQGYVAVVAGYQSCGGLAIGTPAGFPSFFGTGWFGLPERGNGISSCGLSGAIVTASQGVGPVNLNYNLNNVHFQPGNTTTYNGSAEVSANYGAIGVGSTAQVVGTTAGYSSIAETVAVGVASDSLDFAGSGSGYVTLGLTYNGGISQTIPANNGSAQVEIKVQLGGVSDEVFYGTVSGGAVTVEGSEKLTSGPDAGLTFFGEPVPGCVKGTGSYNCVNGTVQTVKIPVTFGAPTSFSLGMIAVTDSELADALNVDPPSFSLTSIDVYNAGGTLLNNFSVTSGSGAVYGPSGVISTPAANTPEPGSAAAAGLALIALGLSGRLRKRL